MGKKKKKHEKKNKRSSAEDINILIRRNESKEKNRHRQEDEKDMQHIASEKESMHSNSVKMEKNRGKYKTTAMFASLEGASYGNFFVSILLVSVCFSEHLWASLFVLWLFFSPLPPSSFQWLASVLLAAQAHVATH